MDPPALYELQGAEVHGPLGRALAPLDLVLRDHAVTALVGPVGSGKSTLLRLLSGRPPSEGWSIRGRWSYRGEELDSHRRAPLRDVAWVPQIRHAPAGAFEDRGHLEAARARLDAAFFCGARVLLLDEPTRGLPEQDRAELRHKLREQVDRGAAIVVTHDIELARAVADDVCMLYDGELVALRRATDFFEHPGSDLERQFVREGTCSMPPSVPGLPRHFYWLEPQRLAGMGRPGLLRDLDDDLFSIAHAGVTTLVSLTEDPLPTARLRPFGISGRHFPIPDMGVPRMSDTIALCHGLVRAIDRGDVVAVHCHAGLGRTGTILACLAVTMGDSGQRAIERVRHHAAGSIQTEQQVAFVHEYEARR